MKSPRSLGRIGAAVFVAMFVLWSHPQRLLAATAAGTVITNTSSATYQDSSSNSYGANSNTVSITVQNAPSMTVTASSNKTIAPGQTVTDAFTIANTGNAAGDVQITSGGVTGGTDSSSTTVTYSYNGTSYATLAALNTALASVSVPVSGSIVVSVVYAVATSAPVGDVQTNLTGTITYAAVSGAAAATSTGVSASSAEDDSVQLDALLDVSLASTNSSGTITYTVGAVNRTTVWGAKDLLAVRSLLGISTGTGGIFISVKVPQYPAGTPLTITGTPAVTTSSTYGFASGATATIYSTANTTGASGWTAGATPVANAAYIGVYVSGGSCTINGASMSGVEICPIASSGSSAGTVPNPAITLTFAVTQSSASGSANAGSTQTIANSLIGSNASTEYVIGPGITANSLADSTSDTATITTAGEGINNTTSVNAPSGASALNSTQSISAYSCLNGPLGNSAATGSYDGSTNDNTHDFTAISFTGSNTYTTTNTTASYSPTTSSVTSGTVSGIQIEHTLANTGNSADTYTVTAQAPAGWKVYIEADSGGAAGTSGPTGASFYGSGLSSAGGTSVGTNVAVASGATLNYWTVYTAPAGVAYLSHVVGTITAVSNGNTSVSNATADLIYAGFVALTTSATTTPNCPSGVSPPAGSVCPGGTINFTIDYRNIVGGSSNYDTSSVPAVSFAGVMTKAGTFVITADGTNGTGLGNNWGTYTGGPTAAPVDSTAGTTFAYYTGSTGATSAASFQAGITKFLATVGGSTFQLVPYGYNSGTHTQGTITFSVVAN